MIQEQLTPNNKDQALWETAKKRINFKKSFLTYAILNVFFWCLWLFNDGAFYRHNGNFPWPLWVTLGWGLGIAFQYRDAYIISTANSIQKEYEKLKNNN